MKKRTSMLLLTPAMVLLIGCAVMTHYSIGQLVAAIDSARETHLTLLHLERVQSNVKDMESGARGFLLTGDTRSIQQSQDALRVLDVEIDEVRRLISDNVVELQLLARTEKAIEDLGLIRLPEQVGSPVPLSFIAKRNALLEEIARDSRRIEMIENDQLDAQQKDVRAHTMRMIWASAICGALTLALLLVMVLMLRRQLAERTEARNAMAAANEALTARMVEVQQRSLESQLLSDMSEVLQVSANVEESGSVLPMFMTRLFPGFSGAVYALKASRNLLDMVATWGDQTVEPSFAPDDCWALRKGRVHVGSGSVALVCRHNAHAEGAITMCVPMVAQGDAIGILHLTAPAGASVSAELQFSAKTVADQISLALANLRLQETLRTRAVRDPLTGLFNRRYLEESFERELRRAQRNRSQVGVMMLDIDHFKRFNDTFGHQGGDALLQQFGHMMKNLFREEDIICRYGGEEFSIMMTDTSEEALRLCAEQLRDAVKHLHVRLNGQSLGSVTVSIGIAVAPDHGNTVDSVIGAADHALYQAKHGGRDRVVSASNPNALRAVPSNEALKEIV